MLLDLLLLLLLGQVIFDAADPVAEALPAPWADQLGPFQKLLFLRLLRPDKLPNAIQAFVAHEMGQKFVEPPQFDLDKCYQDSNALTPLIFVLSPGSDPMSVLLKYADGLKIPVRGRALSAVLLSDAPAQPLHCAFPVTRHKKGLWWQITSALLAHQILKGV